MKKWEDMSRQDLRNIPLAIERGWLPEFTWKDNTHGRVTPENPPCDRVTFSKGISHIWSNIDFSTHEKIWTKADLIDGNYCNHERSLHLSKFLI